VNLFDLHGILPDQFYTSHPVARRASLIQVNRVAPEVRRAGTARLRPVTPMTMWRAWCLNTGPRSARDITSPNF
jgi:hypothetical protein